MFKFLNKCRMNGCIQKVKIPGFQNAKNLYGMLNAFVFSNFTSIIMNAISFGRTLRIPKLNVSVSLFWPWAALRTEMAWYLYMRTENHHFSSKSRHNLHNIKFLLSIKTLIIKKNNNDIYIANFDRQWTVFHYDIFMSR